MSNALDSLVEYMSDEDNDNPVVDDQRKLPLPTSLKRSFPQEEEVVDDPDKHDGRIRNYPHQRGNWNSLVYIPYQKNGPFDLLCDQIIEFCEPEVQLKKVEDPHISLTRTFVLLYHWIDNFVTAVKGSIQTFSRFDLQFDELKIYCNEEETRTFLALTVGFGKMEITKSVQVLDKCLSEYKLHPFYNRTLSQLQKCWDNIKTKRKKQLAIEKKQRMATGGGPYKSPPREENPLLDQITQITDIELSTGVDSDTLAQAKAGTCDSMYLLEESSGTLIETNRTFLPVIVTTGLSDVQHTTSGEMSNTDETHHCYSVGGYTIPDEPRDDKVALEALHQSPTPPMAQPKTSGKKPRKIGRDDAVDLELRSRLKRQNVLCKYEEELHQLRKEELKVRIEIAEEDLRRSKILTQAAEIRSNLEHEKLQTKLNLEIEILKKQLEEASFHMSILWCLGNKKSELEAKLPELNKVFEANLSDSLDLTIPITSYICKIGNKIYNLKLL